jgi:hypothetical protein
MRQPRGVIGILIVLALAAILVTMAFYKAPWMPFVLTQPAASSTSANQTNSSTPVRGQYELTEADNGKTFAYPITSRFTVILDGSRFAMPPACVPVGIVGTISNIPAVPVPYVAARFEAVVPGTCVMTTNGWSATIQVTNGSGE